MAGYTAKDVQMLRQETGAGIMDAKDALVECDGDFEKAKIYLREKGIAKSEKRSDRENSEGTVALAESTDVAVLVELKCETDFVAKSELFTSFANRVAELVLQKNEQSVTELEESLNELKITLKENIAIGRIYKLKADNNSVTGTYMHMQSGRCVNAVVVELLGGDKELAHDIAVHIAFTRPPYLNKDEIPEDILSKEKQTLENITRNEGKPEAVIPKIIEGRLKDFYRENCLMEQPYVKDEKKSIKDILGSAEVKRFVQIVIGQ
jgi:elongation factor Ts